MKNKLTALSVAALIFGLAACSTGAEIKPAAPASTQAAATEETFTYEEPTEEPALEQETEEPTKEAAEIGTRKNPAPYKDNTVTLFNSGVEEWEVGITKVNLNANKVIANENMFNEPPAKGNVYVMATVDATYLGDESGLPWIDLDFQFVSADGRSFDEASVVQPDSLSDVADLYEGASGNGNVVFEVPSKDVDKGTIAISHTWGDAPSFFTVK